MKRTYSGIFKFLLTYHLLQDARDFYDVAQDEFGCFNRPQPTCEKIPLENHLFITGGVLIAVLALYHHYETRKQRKIGCKIAYKEGQKLD